MKGKAVPCCVPACTPSRVQGGWQPSGSATRTTVPPAKGHQLGAPRAAQPLPPVVAEAQSFWGGCLAGGSPTSPVPSRVPSTECCSTVLSHSQGPAATAPPAMERKQGEETGHGLGTL